MKPAKQLPPEVAREERNRAAGFAAVLAALAIWFAYDGWFNPKMKEHLFFNRSGAVLLAAGAIYQAIVALRMHKAIKSAPSAPASKTQPPSSPAP